MLCLACLTTSRLNLHFPFWQTIRYVTTLISIYIAPIYNMYSKCTFSYKVKGPFLFQYNRNRQWIQFLKMLSNHPHVGIKDTQSNHIQKVIESKLFLIIMPTGQKFFYVIKLTSISSNLASWVGICSELTENWFMPVSFYGAIQWVSLWP